jgi:hypothetical protein
MSPVFQPVVELLGEIMDRLAPASSELPLDALADAANKQSSNLSPAVMAMVSRLLAKREIKKAQTAAQVSAFQIPVTAPFHCFFFLLLIYCRCKPSSGLQRKRRTLEIFLVTQPLFNHHNCPCFISCFETFRLLTWSPSVSQRRRDILRTDWAVVCEDSAQHCKRQVSKRDALLGHSLQVSLKPHKFVAGVFVVFMSDVFVIFILIAQDCCVKIASNH